MDKLTFECETITPMFLAGADGKTPELRPPSIKAAMRFWWRAINADKSIDDLKKEEAKIFGGSGGNEENGNKSQIIVGLSDIYSKESGKLLPRHNVTAIHRPTTNISILDYLTFGPCSYDRNSHGNVFNRNYLETGAKFSIKINYNPYVIVKDDIEFLILLVGYIGGIGAKSRNGFGRFKITNLNANEYLNFDKLIGKIKSLRNNEADFTSFSKNTKAFALKSNGKLTKWDDCLAELGEIYKSGRELLDIKHHYDNRQYIASPIIVGRVQESLLERHSKSYFLTVVHKGGYYNGYIFFLPYDYCSYLEKPPLSHTTLKTNYDSSSVSFNTFLSSKMGALL